VQVGKFFSKLRFARLFLARLCMQVSYEALIKDLSKRKFAPIYFLEGEEPYYIDKIADFLEEHVIEAAQKDFNQTILYGRDTEMAEVLSASRRYTMFSDKQLIIVREAAPLFTRMSDKDQTLFTGYLENPMPDTLLVFCHKHKNVDKRTSVGKLIKEKTVYLDSPKIKEYHLPEWILSHVKENGFGIELRTAQLLAEYLGNDLSRISNEIEKLHILIPGGATITMDIVEEHIGISKEFNHFEFKDAILARDFHKCIRIIQYFGHNPGAGPIPLIISSLYAEYSKLYAMQQLPGLSDNEYVSKIGMNPMGMKSLKAAARYYPLPKVEQVLLLLSVYDTRSKGVNNKNADVSALLNELAYRIIYEKV